VHPAILGCSSYGAAWLVFMATIVELAELYQVAQFGKISIQLFGLDIPQRQGF
jgi:hypothetical protein